MSKLNTDWPMDRVLTDEMRSKIQSTSRWNLSTSRPRAETELTDGLPLDVDVLLLRRFEETLLHVEILIERDEHPELVVDDAMDCPHHIDGDRLSTLADMGAEYADLEQDLLEVTALMCELPEYDPELERYVDRVAFQSVMCGEGLLTFRFEVRIVDVIVQLYQDYEHELGE